LDWIDGDDTLFEQAPLEKLASSNQLSVFQHGGFFQPVDTIRELHYLEELWSHDAAPWKVW
jgi:glucose-1-phosphate cytidylyltransferase